MNGDDDSRDVKEKQLFQEKADEASVILAVISTSFSKSTTCKQQLFYCENRKRVLFLKYDDFKIPGWMKMLVGSSSIEDTQRNDFHAMLKRRLSTVLDPEVRESPQNEIDQARINCTVTSLKKSLPSDFSVYVCGGISKDQRIKDICLSVGTQLASLPVTLVTGGSHGVEEMVSSAFHEKSDSLSNKNKLWHIRAVRESRMEKNSDSSQGSIGGSIQGLSFGRTLFCGGSTKERDLIVSEAFDCCIIIDGDSCSLSTAEQFIWNDHTLIPIECTEVSVWGGGSVQEKAFQIPAGVDRSDWSILTSNSTPDLIGMSVVKIISNLIDANAQFIKKPIGMQRIESTMSRDSHYMQQDLKRKDTMISRDSCYTTPDFKLKPILKKPVSPKKEKSSLSKMKTVIL